MQLNTALSHDLHLKAREAQAAGGYLEAEALYTAAIQADRRSFEAQFDRGAFYKLLGRLDEAEISLRAAHKLDPSDPRVRHALGVVLLSQGRYRDGWRFYDARHEISGLGVRKPQLPFPEWNGEDLAGKRLLIAPEQGLGDQIQYARFAPWLATKGAEVTLICHPPLAPLFQQSFEVRVIAGGGEVEFPDPDYWVMSGSLTGRSGLEPDQIPNAPYLRSTAPRQGLAASIGIATRGNPQHVNDANRSLPPALAEELRSLEGAISLHPEDTGVTNFAETAALVAGLDLVISVDTSVAHLAAALGKPTWILLPRLMTDWRWMEGRDDSPWYPTARLFRQPEPGDWRSVLAEVRAALRRRADARARWGQAESPDR